jgi:hypothetical protein
MQGPSTWASHIPLFLGEVILILLQGPKGSKQGTLGGLSWAQASARQLVLTASPGCASKEEEKPQEVKLGLNSEPSVPL